MSSPLTGRFITVAVGETTASRVIAALDRGQEVQIGDHGRGPPLTFRKRDGRYRCETPGELRTYRDERDLRSFLERLRLTEPG